MTTKFRGSLDDLKEKVGTTGIGGEWAEAPPGKWRFRGEDGTIVNWWPKTGTIQFQGQGDLPTIRKVVTGESGSLDAVLARRCCAVRKLTRNAPYPQTR